MKAFFVTSAYYYCCCCCDARIHLHNEYTASSVKKALEATNCEMKKKKK